MNKTIVLLLVLICTSVGHAQLLTFTSRSEWESAVRAANLFTHSERFDLGNSSHIIVPTDFDGVPVDKNTQTETGYIPYLGDTTWSVHGGYLDTSAQLPHMRSVLGGNGMLTQYGNADLGLSLSHGSGVYGFGFDSTTAGNSVSIGGQSHHFGGHAGFIGVLAAIPIAAQHSGPQPEKGIRYEPSSYHARIDQRSASLDNFVIAKGPVAAPASVPEPASVVVWSLIIVGVGIYMWRKKY